MRTITLSTIAANTPPTTDQRQPSFPFIRSARFRRISIEGSWIVIGQGAAVVGSVVGVRLMTGLLNPAAYGELALGMTAATLVNQTILGPLQNGVSRFYAPAREEGDLARYLSAVRRMTLSATVVITLVAVASTGGLLMSGRTHWVPIALAALLFAALSGYNSILSGIQNAGRQRAIVALHRGLESWAQYFVAAGLMAWLGLTSTVAMTGYAVAIVLVLLSQWVFFQRIVPQQLNWAGSGSRWREQIWAYSWPFSTFGIFTCVQQVSDRWALEIFTSARDVGLYTVVFQLGYYPVSLATGLAMQFLAPILYQRAGNAMDSSRNTDVSNLISRLTRVALGLTVAGFLFTLSFHRWILSTLVAPEYVSVSPYLPWMLLSGGLFAAGQTISLDLMTQMKTRALITGKLATALLGTLLNLAGAYWHGLFGIVLASNAFSMSYFAWMLVLSKNLADQTPTKSNP